MSEPIDYSELCAACGEKLRHHPTRGCISPRPFDPETIKRQLRIRRDDRQGVLKL